VAESIMMFVTGNAAWNPTPVGAAPAPVQQTVRYCKKQSPQKHSNFLTGGSFFRILSILFFIEEI